MGTLDQKIVSSAKKDYQLNPFISSNKPCDAGLSVSVRSAAGPLKRHQTHTRQVVMDRTQNGKGAPASGEPPRHFLDHGVLYRSQAAGFPRQGDTELRPRRDQAGVLRFNVCVERFSFCEDASA